METNWRDSAACRGLDTELFYERHTQPIVQRICSGCPVRPDCMESAIEDQEMFGWWGGSYRGRRQAGMSNPPREPDWAVALLGHGTADGFKRHILDDEHPCGACRQAWSNKLNGVRGDLNREVRDEAV